MNDDQVKLDLYLAHRSALIDYAAPIVGCRTQAEDVVQESYFRFVSLKDGLPLRQPVAYLFRIVRNLALDCARRVRVEVPGLPDAMAENLPANAACPERTALYRDELRVLAEALGELPQRTRTAFAMHRLEGRTLQEIAAHLSISVGLAHQLVRDAVTHCAERLGELEN